jgi:hypothetical protein
MSSSEGRSWLPLGLALGSVLVFLIIAGHRFVPVLVDYIDSDTCVGCHARTNGHLVSQWLSSVHFSQGLDCVGCHGDDHEAMFAVDGDVSPLVCAKCHRKEYEEFGRSSHAKALEAAEGSARFLVAPGSVQRQGCLLCHNIGRVYPDGGVGECSHCHSAHRYSVEEARGAHACDGCHMGPDHPQAEAWAASKHGLVYQASEDESVAPTCTTCHMAGETGHDNALNLTLGRSSSGATFVGTATGVPMKQIGRAEFKTHRARMVEVCRRCHSESFARRHLGDADDIKLRADALIAEAAYLIRDLNRDGLLDPMPKERPPHPKAGHALVLGGDQLYSDTSLVEQLFFEMIKFHHAATFKGAYHFSPDHTHWFGWAKLQASLTRIRAESRRLRAAAKTSTEVPQ